MVDLTKHRSNELAQNSSLEKNKSSSYDKQSKVFFLTLNNPQKHGYTHDFIIDTIHTKFRHFTYWCMCDEIGESGGNYHTHIYILLGKKKRWSSVQRAFLHSHIEEKVMGSPQECRAYIRKEGERHKEKKETNLSETFYEEGTIPTFKLSNDRVEMLIQIEDMINQGMRPEQIMQQSVVFRQFETIIRKSFFAKRLKETPPLRQIKIVWHLGASGSGKSFSYTQLCEQYGEDEVFFASDYSNNCTALFDGYEAQKVVFLDEVKTDSFKYGYLLQILQGYKTQIHARYCNIQSLWTEIHATSIYAPDEIYDEMVAVPNRTIDSKTQLLRRITDYCYHWKDEEGYHSFQIPSSEYKSYKDLKERAEGKSDDFRILDESEDIPFVD